MPSERLWPNRRKAVHQNEPHNDSLICILIIISIIIILQNVLHKIIIML